MKEYSYEKIVKNPAVFADNRLPAHSDHIAYRTEEELETGESSFRFSLDGVWKFHYARNIHAAPEGFWQEGYDLSGWDSIYVPADRKSTRLNSSHTDSSRMPSSA